MEGETKKGLSFGLKLTLLLIGLVVLLVIWFFVGKVLDYKDQIESGNVDYSQLQIGALSALKGDIASTNPDIEYIHNFDQDPSIGPEDAALTVVMFEDFECPFCARLFPDMKLAIQKYSDRVRFVYRDFPLSDIHPNAQLAAEAGQCAHEQGKFWEYHDMLFQNQLRLSESDLKGYAEFLELNMQDFDFCLDSGKYEEEVLADYSDGLHAGVTGTPTLFFNGEAVPGVINEKGFDEIITLFIGSSEE